MSCPRFPALIVACFALAACDDDTATRADSGTDADTGSDGFERVGHVDLDDPAFMNQGLAIAGNYAYSGHAFGGGITITDISDPTAPVVVGRIAADTEMVEMVAAPERKLLFAICSACVPGTAVVAYDLTTPTAPVRLDAYRFTTGSPHELFLWQDPLTPSRTLLFVTDTIGSSLHVLDASDPAALTLRWESTGPSSHGASVSADGTRAYVALLHRGLEVMDVASITGTGASPSGIALTPATKRFVDCSQTSSTCITHTAVAVPGRDLAVVTYENQGCPEGWMNIVDIADPTTPTLAGTWRHPKYMLCGDDEPYLGLFGYGPHNPTVTAHLALVSWYRAGLLAFDITDASAPRPVATFAPAVPEPTSEGRWGQLASVSYPIVRDGLIYVLDGRNGIDILRYTGPYADELVADPFFTGNTNL